MNLLLVAMLAGLWIWLLSPGVLRDRRPRSPLASVDSFERLMDTLAPLSQEEGTPRPEGAPHRIPPARLAAQRREQLFRRLVVVTLVTLVVAALFRGWMWVLPGVAGTLLAAYVIALLQFKRRAQLRARVRRLDERRGAEVPAADAGERQRPAREA
jgi:lysylphosphatidylglycerol synthetase-like protein (DUF2156 family)